HLDRACGACIVGGGDPPGRYQLRSRIGSRGAARGDGGSDCAGNLPRDRGSMKLLETVGLTAHYGDFQALFGIDRHLDGGPSLAIIGANGAGKSTLLRSIAGLLATPAESVCFDGAPIGGLAPERIVRLGIAMVPEGRRLFPSLSVEENLLMGAQPGRIGPWSL